MLVTSALYPFVPWNELLLLKLTKNCSLQIFAFLCKFFFLLPFKQQLYYELSKIKIEKFGPAQISMKELKEWLIKNSEVPEDEDEPFVVQYETGKI